MKQISVYNLKGEAISKADLKPEIFEVAFNDVLVHQVVVAQMSNSREVIADTKDRSERRGGGKKPWRQKGTGRARHGSTRSPIWRKGGVTFGPTTDRNFAKKINKKMKSQALNMVLSGKVSDAEFIVVENVKFDKIKTKEVVAAMKNMQSSIDILKGSKDKDKYIFVLGKEDKSSLRAMQNIPNITTISADSLNVVDLLKNKYVVISKEALDVIQTK